MVGCWGKRRVHFWIASFVTCSRNKLSYISKVGVNDLLAQPIRGTNIQGGGIQDDIQIRRVSYVKRQHNVDRIFLCPNRNEIHLP